jgi:tetratricopeptide (TPR) repeat protein
MEKAVHIDPEFAMAYRSMAMSYWNLGLSLQYDENMKKALDLSERLSERELYQIRADFYRESEETYDIAIQAYSQLLNLYPDDTTARHNLALIYVSIEEFDKALEELDLCIHDGEEFVGTYFTMADVYMMKGQYDQAEEILRDYLENVSDNPWIHQYLVFNYICRRQIYIAQAELEIALPLAPTNRRSYYLKGVYDTFIENFVEAEKEFGNAVPDKEPAGPYFGYHGISNLYLIQGRYRDSIAQLRNIISLAQNLGILWAESQARSILGFRMMAINRNQEALREFDKAWDLGAESHRQDLQRLALHYKGLAYLGMRSRSRAQRTAEELKTAIEGWAHRKEIRRYHHLMGMIELDRKNYAGAIEYLEEALALLPFENSAWTEGHVTNNQALYMDSLALAYYRSGNLEKAAELYENLTKLTTGRLYFGGIYAKCFYTLGRIYQQMGDKTKAEDNYNKFMTLWLSADPGFSEVGDAQRRLSGLNRKP